MLPEWDSESIHRLLQELERRDEIVSLNDVYEVLKTLQAEPADPYYLEVLRSVA